MRHEGRSVTRSDKQILTLMVATADVGRIIGKLRYATCTNGKTGK